MSRVVAALVVVVLVVIFWPRLHHDDGAHAPKIESTPSRPSIRHTTYVAQHDAGIAALTSSSKLGWGGGPGQVGKRHDPESAGEGPMSFAIARDGTMYILDQVNGRVVRRTKDGRVLPPIALKNMTAQDIRVDANGNIAVLDRMGKKALERYDANGHVHDVSLASIGVSDPGGATGLYDDDQGALYVEESLRGEGQRVLHPESGGPVLIGRPSRDGRQLIDAAITSRNDGTFVVRGYDLQGSESWESTFVVTPMLLSIILCETDSRGEVFAGVTHATRQGRDLVGEELDVYKLDASGNVLGHVSVMHPPSTLERFRELSVDANGAVCWLHAAADGSGMIVDVLPL